jgi:hypothetical protein
VVFALLNDMNKPKPKAPAGGDVGGHEGARFGMLVNGMRRDGMNCK